MLIEFKIHMTRLNIPGDPRDRQLTVYASLRLGRRTWYLSRWDTLRVQRDRKDAEASIAWTWPGRVMCWYGGRF